MILIIKKILKSIDSRNKVFFISTIVLLLICEVVAYIEEKQLYHAFWISSFRALSFITMGIWYYREQKEVFQTTQKLFLISLLLPIFIALGNCFLIEQKAIFVNVWVSNTFFVLWIIVFKRLGAAIKYEENDTFKKIFPVLFILPLIYYFFVLYSMLPYLYAIIVLIYILLLSYINVLSTFLPINEEEKKWITLGMVLFFLLSFMNGHHEFLQQISWSYPVIRTLAVVARCMIIYGMINYQVVPKVNSNDEN